MRNLEVLFGVLCMVNDEDSLTCWVSEAKNVKFIDVDSANERPIYLAALFRMSNRPFAVANDMIWTFGKKRGVRYVDLVEFRPNMETQQIYDAMGDMMVESALDMKGMALRVKLNKESMLGGFLVKNGYTSSGSDDKYNYFEVSVYDYIER